MLHPLFPAFHFYTLRSQGKGGRSHPAHGINYYLKESNEARRLELENW